MYVVNFVCPLQKSIHWHDLLDNSTLMYVVFVVQGCAVKQLAISKPGDTLAQSGSVYASDNDIELVGEALPFFLINLIAVLLITFVPALSVGVVHWFIHDHKKVRSQTRTCDSES